MIKTSYNYADEFDVDGICTMKISKWNKLQEKVTEAFSKLPPVKPGRYRDDVVELYFGTNEAIGFNSAKQVLSADIKEITMEEYDVLKKLGLTSYGGLTMDEVCERVLENISENLEELIAEGEDDE